MVLLNSRWLVTFFGLLCTTTITAVFFTLRLKIYEGVVVPQLVVMLVVLTYITYFCEKKYKHEFFQIKQNQMLTKEFKHLLELVPESILLYEPDTKKVVMTNAEMQKIIKKYSKE